MARKVIDAVDECFNGKVMMSKDTIVEEMKLAVEAVEETHSEGS